jgi:hypothetical protein
MVAVEWLPLFDPAPKGNSQVEVASLTGIIVSHCKVGGIIRRGGMGIVYRAEDLKLPRAVALKFLPEEFSEDIHAHDRFKHEACAVSTLDHPNICPKSARSSLTLA